MVTDWFHPQWLAVGILILLLCGADALLTLTLMSHGATEINPLMDPLVRGPGQSFAAWKFALTSMGVVILTLLAQPEAVRPGGGHHPLRGPWDVRRARGLRAVSFT